MIKIEAKHICELERILALRLNAVNLLEFVKEDPLPEFDDPFVTLVLNGHSIYKGYSDIDYRDLSITEESLVSLVKPYSVETSIKTVAGLARCIQSYIWDQNREAKIEWQ